MIAEVRKRYLGTQATTIFTVVPCRCGRNVARLSSSNTNVPPGLRACVVRIRSFASHATVQACRHSPSTKRMTVPLGPGGPAGPAAPAGPAGPASLFSPWGRLLFARGERQRRHQQGNHEPADLHGASLDSGDYQVSK